MESIERCIKRLFLCSKVQKSTCLYALKPLLPLDMYNKLYFSYNIKFKISLIV